MNTNTFLWCEKYRPSTVNECILPDRLKTLFTEYVNSKNIPNLLIFGPPGTGKTSIAKALCEDIGCDYIIINGSDESGIDTFRGKISQYASSMSLAGGKKVIILDEAEALNPNTTQFALRNAIEKFATNCSFIFTCNYKERIIEPLHSRTASIDFNLRNQEKATMARDFFNRVKMILTNEDIDYDQKVVIELIKKYFPDYRKILNELQKYSKFGSINSGILAQFSDGALSDVVTYIKNKDFAAVRKWAATGEYDPVSIYRSLYDILYNILQPHSIPQAILILYDYSYKSSFTPDKELNIVACFVELMSNCDFK